MINLIKSYIPLLMSATTLSMGSGLVDSLLTINMRLQGYDSHIIGLVMSANYLGILLGTFFCQKIVQQVGHIRAFTVFAAFITAVTIVHGLYLSAWLWAVLRIGNGVCVTGLCMVIESWLNEKVAPGFRGRLLSIYMVLGYFGGGSGQLLLNVSDVEGQTLFMLGAILFALCQVPISITRGGDPQPLVVPRYNIIKLFRIAPLSMMGCFTAGMTKGSFAAMGPVFALDIGLSVSQVSILMSITIWSGLLFQFPVGLLSDKIDRLKLLSTIGFIVMLVSIGIAVLGRRAGLGVLIPLMGCFGIFYTIYPVALAKAQDNLSKNEIVSVCAALILFFGFGACLGPVAASFIMSSAGPFGLYFFMAGSGGALGGVALVCRNKLSCNGERKGPYIPVHGTASIVSKIDPGSECGVEGAVPEMIVADIPEGTS
jgi:MFS family permease